MKKILILGNNALGLYNFRKELIIKLIEENHEVHFSVPFGEKVKSLVELGAKWHEVEINRRGRNILEEIMLFRQYYDLIKKVNPDIVLTYTIKPNLYGGILSSLLNKQYIENITGLGTALHRKGFSTKLLKIAYKVALKKSEYVFFQNEGNEQFFIDNKIININKAIRIPGSGVNINKYIPSNKRICDNTIRFLYIGRIMKEKGIIEYLESAKSIKEKYENIEFQLVGFNDDVNLKNKFDKFISDGIIRFLGTSNDTRIEMENADCIVLPSYHEGMSNVLLEGAAMGKALIATNIYGCKEIIDEEKNGFLCKPMDKHSLEEAMIKFINLSIKEREDMGEWSRRKVVKEFDRNIIVKEYMEIIDSI